MFYKSLLKVFLEGHDPTQGMRQGNDRGTQYRSAIYYAEDYHQQYLAKVPNSYCGIGGTGVACPIGTGVRSDP